LKINAIQKPHRHVLNRHKSVMKRRNMGRMESDIGGYGILHKPIHECECWKPKGSLDKSVIKRDETSTIVDKWEQLEHVGGSG
jgi:hypothetical protein